jgi:hypothetical protein
MWKLWLVLLACAFIGGGYLGYSQRPEPQYTQDITPPVHTVIKPIDPGNVADLLARANSPIEIERTWQPPYLTVTASDRYKSTRIVDSVILPVKKNFVYGGVGVDKNLSFLYSLGYARNVFGSFYAGSMISCTNSSFSSIGVSLGFLF